MVRLIFVCCIFKIEAETEHTTQRRQSYCLILGIFFLFQNKFLFVSCVPSILYLFCFYFSHCFILYLIYFFISIFISNFCILIFFEFTFETPLVAAEGSYFRVYFRNIAGDCPKLGRKGLFGC
jgi:hypothetical protein